MFNKKAIEFLNGELLGDGCLYPYKQLSACFKYGSKHKEYIEFISDIMESFGIKQMGKFYVQYKKERKSPFAYFYQSLSYKELFKLYKKWYPNGKKIIPEDIKLTSITCRQWYIGDGTLIKPNDEKYKRCNSSIVIYTESFPIKNVEWLTQKLIELGFETTRYQSCNSVHISTHSTPDFLDYIGKCPCKVYDYKWNCNYQYYENRGRFKKGGIPWNKEIKCEIKCVG